VVAGCLVLVVKVGCPLARIGEAIEDDVIGPFGQALLLQLALHSQLLLSALNLLLLAAKLLLAGLAITSPLQLQLTFLLLLVVGAEETVYGAADAMELLAKPGRVILLRHLIL